MKNLRKLIAVLLAVVMVLALSVTASAEPLKPFVGKTIILHSNDVHGAVEGYAYITAVKKDFESKGAEVILADAGDYSQGTPYVSVSKGANAIEMMNAAGYDVATLGNHEFDFGFAKLKENLAKAEFQVICADVFEGDKAILPGHVIIEKGGVKIGFFGLETPETQTKVNPGLIQGLRFENNSAGKTELYDRAKAEVAALKAEGADLIVGIWHLGVDDESAADGHRSIDVFGKVEGIDFVLDGHSHTVMEQGENGEPIQSTGTKFAYVGVVIIDNATKKIEHHYLLETTVEDDETGETVNFLPQDADVLAKAQAIEAEVDAQYGAVFAKSEVELNGAKSPNGNRDTQTNNGNLITEAMLWTVLKEGALEVPTENVVCITNGGGIRAAIRVGDVTMKDINTVLPFGNTVAVVYVTGAELLEALEASTYSLPIGGYPQTTGIQWTLNTTKTYNANAEPYPDSTYYGPATIERVSIQTVNGKAFDPEAKYAVVTNDFCSAGGDTYYVFKNASAQFDTGIPMDEAVVEYIKTELKGVIGQKYATDRGDLTVISIENTVCAPTTQKLSVDGAEKTAEIYNINGENYFKLRDMAALLNGTSAQFEVTYDEETNSITIETGKAYTAVGGELEEHEARTTIVVSPQSLTVNGEEAHLTAFNLDGNNFFRLRDLGRVLGFGVDYDEATRTMLVTTPAAEAAA